MRKLPEWLTDAPTVSLSVKKVPDGVFNYASAILNDGLLLLELRDAIREGVGPGWSGVGNLCFYIGGMQSILSIALKPCI